MCLYLVCYFFQFYMVGYIYIRYLNIFERKPTPPYPYLGGLFDIEI